MRIGILAIGSRGDVQPLVALALGLQAAGHHITFVTHPSYVALAEDFGLRVVSVPPDVERVLASEESDFLRRGRTDIAHYYRLVRQSLPYYDTLARQCWEACRDVDLVLHSLLGTLIGQTIGEKKGVQAVMAYWGPYYTSALYPAPGFPELPRWAGPVTPIYNRLTGRMMVQVPWHTLGGVMNRWRRELGLRPLGTRSVYRQLKRSIGLFGYSEALVPRPADWPTTLHVTGYWFLPEPPGWVPPPDLAEFLAAGGPPVAVTFGSIGTHRSEHITNSVVAALRELGLRGVLCGQGARAVGDDMFTVADVPHSWLFQRSRAVVHHGGSGTTARALWAGVPSVVIPLAVDQPFWAQRLYSSGVAPKPLNVRRLTEGGVAAAIRAATADATLQDRARTIGRQIAHEDGVARAVEALDAEMARPG